MGYNRSTGEKQIEYSIHGSNPLMHAREANMKLFLMSRPSFFSQD